MSPRNSLRGLGGLYRRGWVWWIHFPAGGRVHRESSGSTIKDDAVRLLRQRQTEVARRRHAGSLKLDELEGILLAEGLATVAAHSGRANTER